MREENVTKETEIKNIGLRRRYWPFSVGDLKCDIFT